MEQGTPLPTLHNPHLDILAPFYSLWSFSAAIFLAPVAYCIALVSFPETSIMYMDTRHLRLRLSVVNDDGRLSCQFGAGFSRRGAASHALTHHELAG
jgi:hypothetical protein